MKNCIHRFRPNTEFSSFPCQHRLDFFYIRRDLVLELENLVTDIARVLVLDGFDLERFVTGDGKIVFVLDDVFLGHPEPIIALLGFGQVAAFGPFFDDVRDVVFLDGLAFVVEGEAVGLHVVEPDAIGGAAFGEDDAALAARHEEAHHQMDEQQFSFGGVFRELVGDVAFVDAALERGIGQDDVVRFLFRVGLGERVGVIHFGPRDAVEDQVHHAEADHRGVEVEPEQRFFLEIFPLFFIDDLVADQIPGRSVFVKFQQIPARVFFQNVLVSPDQKSARAESQIADSMAEFGIDQRDDHADDVARGSELAVFAGCVEFAQEVLIEVALGVLILF